MVQSFSQKHACISERVHTHKNSVGYTTFRKDQKHVDSTLSSLLSTAA